MLGPDPGVSGRDSTVQVMRLLVARCEVLYTGRLTATLPEATRLLVFQDRWVGVGP
jgi:RecB family endonuclease NucS